MPSACTKPESKASTEATSPIVQCIQVVEKKVRNLEKRKVKLDTYMTKKQEGGELNEDQKEAISKYDAVMQNIEFAKELQKQFQAISNEVEKLSKKRARKERQERQEREISRIQEVLKLQELLSNMGSEDVREDFKKGAHGAITLTDNNLTQLDELYKLITPSREGEKSYQEQMTRASEHIVNFLDGREKNVTGTTYRLLKELVNKVNGCGYFDNVAKKEEEAPVEPEAAVEEQVETTPEPEVEETTEVPAVVTPEVTPVEHLKPMEPVVPSMPQPAQSLPIQPQVTMAQTMVQSMTHDREPIAAYQDDTFFITPAQPPQQFTQPPRAFQEIVSSVQGNFNFLQDSEIDDNSPQKVDPAVVAALPSRRPDAAMQQASYQNASLLSGDDHTASAAATYGQQMSTDVGSHHAAAQPVLQHLTSDSLDFGAASTPSMGESVHQSNTASQLQFGAVDPMGLDSHASSLTGGSSHQQSTTLENYDQTYGQNLMSQSLGGSTSSQHVSSFGDQSTSLMSSHMNSLQDQSGSASSSSGPPQPIPMPNQVLPGQSLMNQAYGATDSENSASQQQEKKPYTMNPNADPFQSSAMFSQSNMSSMGEQTSSSLPQSTSSTGMIGQDAPRKPAWQTPPSQNNQSQQQTQQQQQQDQQSQQQDNSDYSNSGYGGSNQFGRNSSGQSRGSRGGSRGGNMRGGMNNGFSRGGSRGGSYGGSRGSGSYNNSRGSSRGGGAWQGFPARNDYRPEGGYQGYNSSYISGGMRGGPPRGGGMRGRGSSGGGFSRSSNQTYAQQA